MCFGIGMIVGPAAGGLLFELGNFSLPFFVAGALTLLGGVLALCVLPQSKRFEKTERTSILTLMSNFSITLNVLISVTAFFIIGFNDATLEHHIRQISKVNIYLQFTILKPSVIGGIFLFSGLLYASGNQFWGYLADKINNCHWACIAGFILAAIAFALCGPAYGLPLEPNIWLVLLAQGSFGMATGGQLVGSFTEGLKETVKRGFPENISTYAMISALFSSGFSTGGALGPVFGGFLVEHYGYRKACYGIIVLELIMAESKGVTPTQYGFVFAVYELLCFLFCPIIPHLTPKFFILIGLFIAGYTYALFGLLRWSPPGNMFVALSFIIRSITAIGGAAFSTGGYTSVAVYFPSHMAQMIVSFYSGEMIYRPAIGGVLYQFTNLTSSQTGAIFLACGLFYATSTQVWGNVADKMRNPQILCLIGFILSIVSFSLTGPIYGIPLKPNIWLIVAAQIMFGVAMGGQIVGSFAAGLREVATSIGPAFGGIMIDHIGYRKACIPIVGIQVVLVIVIILFNIFRTKPKNENGKELQE
ncbi:MFS-type transporter-like protein [Dinothrombium tinctorium]|uniref:MFS-type transporter-like protein n=1 Tax=Dinothrombium tinctorium TaxID=1965070 RepID=A0A3S3QU29_9ACAR|nr:MFS-type transporter-like protein [Dinothrombium tinctorium]